MASITKDPGGNRRIQFVLTDGRQTKRHAIRLGKVTERVAQAVKLRIEHLLAAKIAGHSLDSETAAWLAGIDEKLHSKLVKAGLARSRQNPAAVATSPLGPFLDDYVSKRTDVKEQTRETWRAVILNLKAHFGAERDIATITEGEADGFKLYLIEQKLAATTVHKRLQHVRQFFKSAKRHKLIAENPFGEVSAVASIDESRRCFVERDDIDRVLEVCDPTWRTIVTLSRFGGLRCPSEVLSLRWQDVDFARGRMVVQSPKTEHHPGGASRVVPIFAELRPFLDDAFELAADGAEYVVAGNYREAAMTPKGWACCNLRTQFERLLTRAGVRSWPKPFQNMRASRETELAALFPIQVVTAWLGNTPKIAMKHYLRITEGDFTKAIAGDEKAAHKAAHFGAKVAQNAAQQDAVPIRTDSQTLPQDEDSQELVPLSAAGCEVVRKCQEEKDWGTRI